MALFASAPASKKLADNVASLESRLQAIAAEEARLNAAAAESRAAIAAALLEDPGASLDRMTAASEKVASEAAGGAARRASIGEALEVTRARLAAAIEAERLEVVERENAVVASRQAARRARLAKIAGELASILWEGEIDGAKYLAGPGDHLMLDAPEVVRDASCALLTGPSQSVSITIHFPATREHRAP